MNKQILVKNLDGLPQNSNIFLQILMITLKSKRHFKGNAQFLFLCNPQKSGALRVCITFPQIIQKILT